MDLTTGLRLHAHGASSVNNTHPIGSARIKIVVAHPKRIFIERHELVPPRLSTSARRVEVSHRRLKKLRIVCKSDARDYMGLCTDPPQIVVITSRARVSPMNKLRQLCDAPRLRWQAPNLHKLLLQPVAAIKRHIYRVQRIATAAHTLVQDHAQLHPNALEQRLGELEDSRP